MQKVARRFLIAVLLTFVGALSLVFSASPALAHAQLIETSPSEGEVLPASPKEITFTFSEQVTPVSGAFLLYDSQGTGKELHAHSVDEQVIAYLNADLSQGSYALVFQVVSADGHPVSGQLNFSVISPSDSGVVLPAPNSGAAFTEVIVGLLSGIQYLLIMWMFGAALFSTLVLRGAVSKLRVLVCTPKVAYWILLLVALLLVPFSALRTLGADVLAIFSGAWISEISGNSLLQSALVVLAAIAGLSLGSGANDSVANILRLLVYGVAICGLVLVGHTQSAEPISLLITTDITHLLAGSFWLAGVICLAKIFSQNALLKVEQLYGSGARQEILSKVVYRFSGYAMLSVLLLAVSGVIMATYITGDLFGILSSNYGRALLLKISVVLVVIGIAFYNRLVLIPRTLTDTDSGTDAGSGSSATVRNLREAIKLEAALISLVVIITGFLSNLSPFS